jgi:hypothetical protein
MARFYLSAYILDIHAQTRETPKQYIYTKRTTLARTDRKYLVGLTTSY